MKPLETPLKPSGISDYSPDDCSDRWHTSKGSQGWKPSVPVTWGKSTCSLDAELNLMKAGAVNNL